MADGNYGTGLYGADYYSATIDVGGAAAMPAATSDMSAGTIIHVAAAGLIAALSTCAAANAFRIAVGFASSVSRSVVSILGELFWAVVAAQTVSWSGEQTPSADWAVISPTGDVWAPVSSPAASWTKPAASAASWTVEPPQN